MNEPSVVGTVGRPEAVLAVDTSAIGNIDHDLRGLIAEYSPVFILFPESEKAGPPYPEGEADYHPRAADVFLDHARLVSGVRASVLAVLLLLVVFSAIGTVAGIGLGAPQISLSLLGAMGAGVAFAVGQWVVWPKGGGKVRDVLAKNLRSGLRQNVLTVQVHRSHAWKRYFDVLTAAPKRYPLTVYVNVVGKPKGTAGIAVQYWLFFFCNDFWNFHEADWEVATVFFRYRQEGYQPVAAAYSNHLGGRWRRWRDIATLGENGTHPVVYVARGSHALYFEPSPDGYETFLPVSGKRILFLRVDLRIARDDPAGTSRDFVPSLRVSQRGDVKPDEIQHYQIAVVPPYEDQIIPGNREVWRNWWWLRYQGSWGSIRGPACQKEKWNNPWHWVHKSCVADAIGGWRRLTG